jgi:hypothetical protein
MVMGPGSAQRARTAAPRDKGERRSPSEPLWSCIRLVILLLLAVGLGWWGWLLRPTPEKPISVSEPRITIVANQPDVTATVDMTLSSDLGQATPYTLTLTLTPANPGQDVTFAVSFGNFPAAAASGTGPLHGPKTAQYALISSTPGLPGAALLGKPFTYASAQQIGENSQGAQLRVAFPNLIGEQPGAASVKGCGRAGSLASPLSTICSQLGNKPTWSTPSLDAGTSTFSSPDPALGNYQYLAGDDPTLLGGNQWMWTGVNGVQVLAANVQAQGNAQNQLFYAGLLLGVAASAGIACLAELLRPVWRKGAESGATKSGQPPTGQG